MKYSPSEEGFEFANEVVGGVVPKDGHFVAAQRKNKKRKKMNKNKNDKKKQKKTMTTNMKNKNKK